MNNGWAHKTVARIARHTCMSKTHSGAGLLGGAMCAGANRTTVRCPVTANELLGRPTLPAAETDGSFARPSTPLAADRP